MATMVMLKGCGYRVQRAACSFQRARVDVVSGLCVQVKTRQVMSCHVMWAGANERAKGPQPKECIPWEAKSKPDQVPVYRALYYGISQYASVYLSAGRYILP